MFETSGISIDVYCNDALMFEADVLALKYADEPYGVDMAVITELEMVEADIRTRLPQKGEFRLVDSRSAALSAPLVLFVGVGDLYGFDYAAIRSFGRQVLSILAVEVPEVRHVALTLHGPGYGLDESEAFRAEIAGLLDAIAGGEYPEQLTRITIVERSEGRAIRLSKLLSDLSPASPNVGMSLRDTHQPGAEASLETVGVRSRQKKHVFVAMPFASEFDDLFHYGIQGAVNAAGYLCERADLASFTGDVIAWVKDRISTASLLVADLSTANPNVYLEVGYAWGKGIPTVLVSRNAQDLKFDVRGQRCLIYSSIRNLEETLAKELRAL